MSWVAQRTHTRPFWHSSTLAVQGMRAADQDAPPTPQPMTLPLRFIEPTSGVRCFQPIFSAPVGVALLQVARREGKILAFVALGVILQAQLKRIHLELDRPVRRWPTRARTSPGTAPGPRMGAGAPTLRRTMPVVTSRFGQL